MKSIFRAVGLVCGLSLGVCSLAAVHAGEPDDVIAKVGTEVIHFHELDMTINSSAMLGMTIPKPGTRERTNLRLTMLDREISADLLYLDALKRGVDKSPVFRSEREQFSDAILASKYKEKYLIGDLPVSDQEIREFFDRHIKKGTAFTQDVHMAIEATIRKEKFKQKVAAMRDLLRKGIDVKVIENNIDPSGDKDRDSATEVASVAGEKITWGEVRQDVGAASSTAERRKRLENLIDLHLMVSKAKQAGMEKEPGYLRRMKEFAISTLAVIRRNQLDEKLDPTDAEVRAYFKKHRDKITVPAVRKVQMVVVKTREEAEKIKQQIDAGKITVYQAAQKYSIDPNAKKNLGELGWVAEGTGFPALDKVAFAVKPGEIGGPVKSPAGWHLVKVLDARDAEFADINDHGTWKKAHRLLLHDKVNDYIDGLREKTFHVEVYSDVFSRLTQEEVNAQKAAPPPRAGSDG